MQLLPTMAWPKIYPYHAAILHPLKTQKTVDELNANRQGSLLDFIEDFTQRFPACIDQYEQLLTDNRIWRTDCWYWCGTDERAKALGFSGCSCIVWRICAKWPVFCV